MRRLAFTERRGPVALVSLPHPPMIGFKENELVARRFHYNEWDVVVKEEDGSRLDLTAVTIMEFVAYRTREVRGDRIHYVDPEVKLAIGSGLTITTALEGEVQISIPRTQLEARDPGLYWYDLWYEDSSSNHVMLIDKAEFRVQE